MKICKRCEVYGRVQGVFFRASTQRQAETLGLGGWARNRADGSVEVLACGDQASVDALAEWLWEGPRHAQVDEVRCRQVEYEPQPRFDTG